MSPCIYCGAPWLEPVLDIDHQQDCPFVTNLWPVQWSDLKDGLGCADCGEHFIYADTYTHVLSVGDDGHTDTAVVEVVCLSCAWKAATS